MPFEVQRDPEVPERSPSCLAVTNVLRKDESALTNPMRVLIAEDDSALANFVRKGLEAEHYAVDVTSDGEQARAMAGEMDYDLLMLDSWTESRSFVTCVPENRACRSLC